MNKFLIFAISFLLIGCEAGLKTDEGRFSYSVGYEIGRNMKRQGIDLNSKAFIAAISDVMKGKKIRLNEAERREAIRKMSTKRREADKKKASKNKMEGEKFLEENKSKDGITTTKSGVQYQILSQGNGPKPKATDKVKVHYKGTLIDGTEFDSSYKRNKPAEFPLNAVIPGWTEALQLMSKGSKYKIFIPPSLGYGARSTGSIPANSVLIFEVELLDIMKSDKKKSK